MTAIVPTSENHTRRRPERVPLSGPLLKYRVLFGVVFGLCLATLSCTEQNESVLSDSSRKDTADNAFDVSANDRVKTAFDGLKLALETPSPEKAMQTLKAICFQAVDALVQADPERVEPIAVKALTYSTFGQHDDAIRCWKACLELNPDFADAHHGICAALILRGEFEEAAQHALKALDNNPRLSDVRVLAAKALLPLGRIEEAVEILRQGTKLFPDSPDCFFWLGQAHLQLLEYKAAKMNHTRVLQLNPYYTHAHYGLAMACQGLGDRDGFKQHMAEFKRLKARDQAAESARMATSNDLERVHDSAAFVFSAVAEIDRRQHRIGNAESCLIEAALVDPGDFHYIERLASLYDETGQPDRATQVLNTLCKLQPDQPLHLVNLGKLQARSGQMAQAEQTFRKVVEQAPESSEAFAALAKLCLHSGQRDAEALKLAEHAVDLAPNAENYYILSLARMANGRTQAALTAIDAALLRDTTNTEYLRCRAVLLETEAK